MRRADDPLESPRAAEPDLPLRGVRFYLTPFAAGVWAAAVVAVVAVVGGFEALAVAVTVWAVGVITYLAARSG